MLISWFSLSSHFLGFYRKVVKIWIFFGTKIDPIHEKPMKILAIEFVLTTTSTMLLLGKVSDRMKSKNKCDNLAILTASFTSKSPLSLQNQ